MAASRPARPLRKERGMIGVSNKNSAGLGLLLEMALQTKRRVPFI